MEHDDLDGARGVGLGVTLSLLLWAFLALGAWAFGPERLGTVLLGLSAAGLVTAVAALLADGRL